MIRLLIVLTALTGSLQAAAGGRYDYEDPPEPTSQAQAEASSTADSTSSSRSELDAVLEFDPQVDATATSEAFQEQLAEAMAAQDQTQSAHNEGVKTTVTMNTPKQYRRTPNVYAPSIQPTVSCFKPIVGGIGFSGFGASGGSGKIDLDCVKREYIRLAFEMGLLDRAAFMWCQQPTVWEDFGAAPEDCQIFELERKLRDTDLVITDVQDLEDDDATFEVTGQAELVILADVSQKQFDDHNVEIERELQEVKQQAVEADARAQAAERQIETEQQGRAADATELIKLRALLREDYERVTKHRNE